MSSSKSAARSSYLNYLPFGTGQFVQNKSVFGSILLVSEASMLALYFDSKTQADKANADVKAVMGNVDPASAASDPSVLPYLNRNEKFVKDAQQKQKLALISFGALWGLGVAEAVFDPFGSASMSAKKSIRMKESNRSRKRTSSMTEEKHEEVASNQRVGLFVWDGAENPGYGLAMKMDF